MTNRRAWLTLMFITGFCSLVYELAMAQLLAGITGNVFGRFATTLGVYVFGLGLGSILFEPKNEQRDGRLFFKAEVALFIVGLASPFLFVGIHHYSSVVTDDPDSRSWIVLFGTHAIIFATGFISGFELPILASLSRDTNSDPGSSGDASALSADYFGMFAASLVFPLVLFPILGLAAAFWVATLLNLGAAVATYAMIDGRSKFIYSALGAFVLLNIGALVFSKSLDEWFSRIYASVI